MNASILSIGDELGLGQTVDTNSAWLSQRLASVGCDIVAHMTVPDDQAATERAMKLLSRDVDVLIISGGIGPTEDDLTRHALAAVMDAPLERSEAWMTELKRFFEARGRPMAPSNAIQAMIPRGAKMLWNTAGTASGINAKLPRENLSSGVLSSAEHVTEGRAKTNSLTCEVFVVPGVPKEMKTMFERDVLPFVRAKAGGAVLLQRTLHTFGLGESTVAERLGELMKRGRNPSVGTTVAGGMVSLRVNGRFASLEQGEREMKQTVDACYAKLGDVIFGVDGQPLAENVAAMLKADHAGSTVATAESCTGGLLATMLTDIAGSSSYFRFGWVTYANEAKQSQLGVPENLLRDHGAVSEPVAIAMADGARARADATYALAVSGIAGPGGGTPAKPVGTVCIALARPGGATIARTFNFPGDREMIRDRSAKMALSMLRYELLGKAMPW